MKLEIKNFGPIKEGKIKTKKVTVLIGNQGSGKSTVAKLLAIFAEKEKNVFIHGKPSVNILTDSDVLIGMEFIKSLKYYCIQSYTEYETNLKYENAFCAFKLQYESLNKDPRDKHLCASWENRKGKYLLPQITYFPSERNFVSSIKKTKGGSYRLDLQSLQEFKEIFQEAKDNMTGSLKLPINDTEIIYDKISEILYVIGKDYKIRLSNSASGFQSFVPMFVVADYLSKLLKDGQEMNSGERDMFKKQSAEILNNHIFTDEQKRMLLSNLASKINVSRTINIIEEPEQNLYPSSQRSMLNSLLGYNNEVDGNELILTTHSPYILSYMMLAVKAAELREKANGNEEILSKIYEIVPEKAITPMKDVVIYELNDDGTISELKQVYGLPSNDNFLNNELGEVNTLFSELMEIEDLCHE